MFNEGEAACWERRSLAPAAHSGTCFCVWLFVRKLLPCLSSLSGLAALAVCPILGLLVTSAPSVCSPCRGALVQVQGGPQTLTPLVRVSQVPVPVLLYYCSCSLHVDVVVVCACTVCDTGDDSE